MQRLSRAGRERAIVYAIKRLNSKKKYDMWTCGEICRAMGIKSSTRIKNMLRDMVISERLVCASTALDGYAHEVEIFGIARLVQMPLPQDHVITINGISHMLTYGG